MNMRDWLRLAIFVLACLALASPALAQRGDDDDDDDRRDRRRFDPVELLQRMDANRNGQLEPDEVSGRARGFVDRYAQQAGLDPKQPLPIDKLSAAMQQGRDADERREGESSTNQPMPATTTTTPMTTPAPTVVTPTAPVDANKPAESKQSTSPPLVPGFDVQVSRSAPPGFGTRLPGETASASLSRGGSTIASSSGSSSSRSSSSSSDNERREAAAKVRRYAEGLLKQYDENKNGVLEKDEWRKMRGDPEKADQNNDNIITLDELSDRLANYSRDSGSSSQSSDDRGGDRDRSDRDRGSDRSRSRSDRDATASDKKSYRFLTPLERLPKGLPTWFTRNDANGDGQVSMAEYSTAYNDATVTEFLKYDLDGDGLITPEECLRAEKDKLSKK